MEQAILKRANACKVTRGFEVGTGTIVDATITSVAMSTKNASETSDPEM